MLKDILCWESLSFLVCGVVAGALYYHFVLEPQLRKFALQEREMEEPDRCLLTFAGLGCASNARH